MKKSLLTFASVLFAVLLTNAQTQQDLYLSWEGETLGDTVIVWGSPDTTEIVLKALVYNNTNERMRIKVRRSYIVAVDSTGDYICWGACYPDFVSETDTVGVPPGLSVDEFSAHYKPQSQIGTAVIEYLFLNEDNEDQNVKIVVKYWASPQGIADDAMKNGSISEVYPNPATNTVSINYELTPEVNSAEVKIVNLLGAVVKEQIVDRNSNKLTLDISDLNGGIYFYTVLINGNVYKTRKLIVQK